MPRLRVRSAARDWQLEFQPGVPLLDLLAELRIRTTAACGGSGVCAHCRVVAGPGAPPPTPTERARLTPTELAAGWRLGCQVRPCADLDVELRGEAEVEAWRRMDVPAPHAPTGRPSWCTPDTPLGVAVDLGTTHLRASLWNVAEGRPSAAHWTPNPQAGFGGDVLSRLAAAGASPAHAGVLRALVLDAIGDGLRSLVAVAGASARQVGRVAIVGNTAMLALVAGLDVAPLLDPDTWMTAIDAWPVEVAGAATAWGLPPAAVHVVRPLAGFVGSDLVAASLAAGLWDDDRPGLLIDFGTNSEVALWDGRQLWATSAAGGPAFESAGALCGMPAEPGAIRRATMVRRSPPAFAWDVLGGGRARGFSGSGLVDVVAALVEAGHLTPAGNLGARGGAAEIELAGEPPMRLGRRDVDAFQRAKAAVAAGASLLLERAGVPPGRLARLHVCGALGEGLDVGHAQAVGLLPTVAAGVTRPVASAALAGAGRLLFADDPEDALPRCVRAARVLNLAHAPDYDMRFVDHLRLRPMPEGRG